MTLAEPPSSADQPVNFRDPPVTEVVLAIQFAERTIDLEVLADFASRVKSAFPRRFQRQPLPPMQEEIAHGESVPQISLEFDQEFRMPRTWFTNEDETKILQLQEDRFVFNWQRPSPAAAKYPRYRVLREWFRERLEELEESVVAGGKEMPGTNFCEVTYVNQVPLQVGDEQLALSDILSAIQKPAYGFLSTPENQQYSARFPIGAAGDGPRGAMYVSAAPAVRPDGAPMYLINLTTRLVPSSDGSESAWSALDLGREWIVKGFVDMTRKNMHHRWGYQEGVDDRG